MAHLYRCAIIATTLTGCSKGYLTEHFPGPMPATESAAVFVMRSSSFWGSARRQSVFLDGWEVAKLSTNQYFHVPVTPGQHQLALGSGGLVLSFAAGDTAYLYISPDGITDNWEIERLTRERAEELMAGATDLTKRDER